MEKRKVLGTSSHTAICGRYIWCGCIWYGCHGYIWYKMYGCCGYIWYGCCGCIYIIVWKVVSGLNWVE